MALKSAFGFYFWKVDETVDDKFEGPVEKKNQYTIQNQTPDILHQYSLPQNIYISKWLCSYPLLGDNVTQVTGNTSQLQIILFLMIVPG